MKLTYVAVNNFKLKTVVPAQWDLETGYMCMLLLPELVSDCKRNPAENWPWSPGVGGGGGGGRAGPGAAGRGRGRGGGGVGGG